MIAEAFAAKQFKRFAALSGGRSISPAQTAEWTRIARTTARTEMQLRNAVTAWLDAHTFPPSPVELRAIIDATPSHGPTTGSNCPTCQGSGRRSFWALVTIEFWADSGNVRRRTCEEIPCTGNSNYWLMQEPELAARVDGISQRVGIMSGYCACPRGVTLRQDQSAAMRSSH